MMLLIGKVKSEMSLNIKASNLDKLRQGLNEYFDKRNKNFWSKKIPKGKDYAYIVHDPFEILGEDSGFEKLYLVGDSWLDNPEKPIAVVVGCNDWKFGFIAEYLKEYRVAFGSRKNVSYQMIRTISGLKIQPEIVVIWGYTESRSLNYYLQYRKIPIWRCEDGFIRSADLGANGATPYSLVFDKKGLYYNPNTISDIENLLNTYIMTDGDYRDANLLMELYLGYGLSKYNPPLAGQDKRVKAKKRVLIVGQVDNDASLKFGNVDSWSIEDVIRLAKYENQDADIIYRPHPEVYRGFQNSKFNRDKISSLCDIQSPDVSIADALQMADHIYTITSLTGIEALFRGKKVTLLGKPFYGGWGLTDDRVSYSENTRARKLNLFELFFISYIIYPKYLVGQENKLLAVASTIYRVLADKYAQTNLLANKIELDDKESFSYLSESDSWVALLDKSSLTNDDNSFIQVLSRVKIGQYNLDSELAQMLIACFLLGKSKTDKTRNCVLTILRKHVNNKVYSKILLELAIFANDENFLKHRAWILGQTDQEINAINMLNEEINKAVVNIVNINKALSIENKSVDYSHSKEQLRESSDIDLLVLKESSLQELSSLIYEKFELQLEHKQLEDAIETAFNLLILNYDSKSLLPKICILLMTMGRYEELLLISKIYQSLDLYSANRSPITYEMQARFQLGFNSNSELLIFLTRLIKLKPELIVGAQVIFDNFFISNHSDDEVDFYKNLLFSHLYFDNDFSARKIQSYIAIEDFHKAERVASSLLDGSVNSQVQYSQALSYNGKLEQAIMMMESSVRISFVKTNVQELLRLNVLASRYDRSLEIIKEASARGLELGDMHLRKAYFGKRMIGDALKAFSLIKITGLVKKYYKEKFYDVSTNNFNFDSIILLGIFGPGDEIRFASIYGFIQSYFADKNIYITCSPRLKSLFERSFPSIQFVGVHRPRSTEVLNLSEYSRVPGSDIYQLVNNNVVDIIEEVDKLGVVTDFLHVFLSDYSCFPGYKYLNFNPDIRESIAQRLKLSNDKNKILVGLSWRSSLTTTSRNEHYLSVDMLDILFGIPEIQFVNFQYDDCVEELNWVNARHPGKLINFEDIDQYNDFESVAALMSCMELIIAPATTVVELAGALGIRTWLFSNSSEIDWRKKDDQNLDVWHNSVKIIDVPEKGNKQKLVERLYNDLVAFVDDCSSM